MAGPVVLLRGWGSAVGAEGVVGLSHTAPIPIPLHTIAVSFLFRHYFCDKRHSQGGNQVCSLHTSYPWLVVLGWTRGVASVWVVAGAHR